VRIVLVTHYSYRTRTPAGPILRIVCVCFTDLFAHLVLVLVLSFYDPEIREE